MITGSQFFVVLLTYEYLCTANTDRSSSVYRIHSYDRNRITYRRVILVSVFIVEISSDPIVLLYLLKYNTMQPIRTIEHELFLSFTCNFSTFSSWHTDLCTPNIVSAGVFWFDSIRRYTWTWTVHHWTAACSIPRLFFLVPQRSSRTLYNFQESFHYKCNCLFKMRRIGHQNLLKIQTGYFGTKDAFNCSVSYKISNRFQMVWLDRFAYDPAMIVPLLGALFRLFLSYRLPKGFCMGIALATTDIQISWAQINPDVSVGKRCRTKRNQNVAQSKTTQ